MKLKDRVAIITGGGKGIGKAIALCFAAEGADIVILDIDLVAAENTVRQIEQIGRRSFALAIDISERDQVSEAIGMALKKFGKIEILVNNAGSVKQEPFLELSPQNWDTTLKTHLTGSFQCSQIAAREMAKNKWGRILNIASVGGIGAPPGLAAYSAAKAGLIGLTRAMAVDLADHGIRVNAIAPGPILTELYQAVKTEEERRAKARSLPCNRLGTVEEIAQVALFFCSTEVDFITGQVLAVDGGSTAIGPYSFEYGLSRQ